MRRTFLFAGAGVLLACLAGWAAFASAQTLPGAPAPALDTPPPEAIRSEPLPPRTTSAPAPVPDLESTPGSTPPPVPAPLPTPAPTSGNPPLSMPAPPSLTGSVPPPPPASSAAETEMPSTTSAKPFSPVESRSDALMAPEGAIGKQEPAVSLEWVGASIAKVGAATDYALVVRNICNLPVQQVQLRVRIPAGMSVLGCEPRSNSEGGVMVWDLATLMPRQERVIQLKLQADTKGDVTPQAWVTFTGSSVLRVRVREPKLQLKCAVSEKVLVGDPAAFTLTVSNPGDGSADQVKIKATLSEGLEHARGNKIDFDIGSLAAGESRNVTLLCATRAGGVQKCEVTAEADGGLSAKDTAQLNVIMPRLDLQVLGPRLRYLDRKAIYALRVTNPGDAPATNVTVADMVPAGFKVLAASDGGRHDFQTRTVSWFLGEIGPGQTREVKLEVQAVNPGEHKHKATAVGARGLRAESELMTHVEGLAALQVQLRDMEDPIEAGGETAYEVRLSNTGSKTETDIKLIATIPDKMQFKNAQGVTRYREEGKTIIFEPLERLEPRGETTFRINVKAMEAGIVRFKIQVTSASLTEPVVKMEATRIYSDAPEASEVGPASGPAASVPPTPVPPTPALPGALPSVPPRENE